MSTSTSKDKFKIFACVFISFVFVFSYFSSCVSNFASQCLVLTGESEIGSSPDQSLTKTALSFQKPTSSAAVKSAAQNLDLTKPVLELKFPKTETPIVMLIKEDTNEPAYSIFSHPFPPLRLYTGEEWNKEKTEIFAATDGQILYFKVICYDSDMNALVKKFSLTQGSDNAWKDDSVEIFISQDADSSQYYQFVASAAGKSHKYSYNSRPDDPRSGRTSESSPADEWCSVTESKDAYTIVWKIPVESLRFKSNILTDGFNLQIVRNYRGQNVDENSKCLHLFPIYIYGDKRFGMCNHHRKAFQPVKMETD
jgi:hypothetical protein